MNVKEATQTSCKKRKILHHLDGTIELTQPTYGLANFQFPLERLVIPNIDAVDFAAWLMEYIQSLGLQCAPEEDNEAGTSEQLKEKKVVLKQGQSDGCSFLLPKQRLFSELSGRKPLYRSSL